MFRFSTSVSDFVVVCRLRAGGALVGPLADLARLLLRGQSSARGGRATTGVATFEVEAARGTL